MHISYTPPKKVPNSFYFLFLKEFLTSFLLYYVLSFWHLSSNVLLVNQIVDRCQSGCSLLSIHNQEAI